MTRRSLFVARLRDRLCRRSKRVLHPWDFRRRWFRELQGFYRHLSREEFWMRYHEERKAARGMEAKVRTVDDAERVYRQTDYYILRQMYYRRDDCYHAVAATIPHGGSLLEFGAGVCPVTAWVNRHRPDVWCYPVDVPGARTSDFAVWRFRDDGHTPWHMESIDEADDFGDLMDGYSVIAAFEVLEHLPAPLIAVERLVGKLVPGGYLHLNFASCEQKGLNLASPDQRRATIDWLDATLTPIYPLTDREMHAVYRRVP